MKNKLKISIITLFFLTGLVTLLMLLTKNSFAPTSINEITNTSSLVELSMQPFWEGNTIYNESMLPVSYAGGIPESPFLFPYVNIISVKDYKLTTTYTPGVDWMFLNNKLILPTGSKIPFLKDTDLTNPSMSAPLDYFHNYQVAVTYTHSGHWAGPKPSYAGSTLPSSIAKLGSASPLKIILYGDSISVGFNMSGHIGAPPFLPPWGQLVVETLKQKYNSNITFQNQSSSGQNSSWGLTNVDSLFTTQSPDLVILAFGMNDGSQNVNAETYKNNISQMINQVKTKNPLAEFILISPMLPNPTTSFLGTQSTYETALQSLRGHGVAVVNMTSIHKELLKTKRYVDLSGNNLNHPNDYLGRWYAQSVVALLTIPTLEQLNHLPIKGVSEITYVVENTQKRAIPDWDTYLSLGFKDGDQVVLPGQLLQSISLGPPIKSVLTPFPTTGDLNGDGKVNVYDFVKLLNGFNTIYTPDDFSNLLANYGK